MIWRVLRGFEQSNAAQTSAAGDGWTETNLYFCESKNVNESDQVHQYENHLFKVVFLLVQWFT